MMGGIESEWKTIVGCAVSHETVIQNKLPHKFSAMSDDRVEGRSRSHSRMKTHGSNFRLMRLLEPLSREIPRQF